VGRVVAMGDGFVLRVARTDVGGGSTGAGHGWLAAPAGVGRDRLRKPRPVLPPVRPRTCNTTIFPPLQSPRLQSVPRPGADAGLAAVVYGIARGPGVGRIAAAGCADDGTQPTAYRNDSHSTERSPYN
jgi:hypothetical protein